MCDLWHDLPTSLGEPSKRTLNSFSKAAKRDAFFKTTAGTGFHGHAGRTSEARQESMKANNQGSFDTHKDAPLEKGTAYSRHFAGDAPVDLGSNRELAAMAKEATKGGKQIPMRSWKATSYSDTFLDPADSCQDRAKAHVPERRAPVGICNGKLHEVKSLHRAQYASPPAFAYKPVTVYRPIHNLSTPCPDVVSSFESTHSASNSWYRSPGKMPRSTSSPAVTRPPSELSPSKVNTGRACSSVVARAPSVLRGPSVLSAAPPASEADRLSECGSGPWGSSSYQKSYHDPACRISAEAASVHGALGLVRRRLQTS